MALLSAVDVLSLACYFGLLLTVSYCVSKRQQRSTGSNASVSYFMADKSVPFWGVGCSLFASNIGSEHFVGLAGTGCASGIAIGWYEWGAAPCLLVLAFFFLPVYLNAEVHTLPQYIEQRFNSRCRVCIVFISLVLYIFTKVSATLFAGQLLLEDFLPINKWAIAGVLIAGTAAYTMVGGLAAVIYTEVLQTVVLLAGGIMLLTFALRRVGGYEALQHELPPDFFVLMRPATDLEYPWPSFVFGYPGEVISL
jgi:SSS family transporter